MSITLLSIYTICMLFIMLFSLGQLHLTLIYKKATQSDRKVVKQKINLYGHKPFVTIQLPVYNERYVVERLLDAVAEISWPKDKIEIQILDDSDDDTPSVIRKKLEEAKFANLDIYHICRKNRKGFKAGALQYGLSVAKGEFTAIFDADFIPRQSFLTDTVPMFDNPAVGMVQTKWEHLNQNFSMLTKLQAFGLNGHFTVEQTGRNATGSYINFNGTGGVWRKSCIRDAGGWQTDTLTEDLDLSYRAQMKGWKFEYLEHISSPSELPVIMSAIKSQQFRWTKGGAETAKKNLSKVIRTKLNVVNKIHAFFHLTNSANFLLLFIASFLSIPLLFVKYKNPEFKFYFNIGSVFIVGFAAIAYFYWIANKAERPKRNYFVYFPLYIIFSMGFTLNNSLAFLEGLLGIKTPFVRTPKFNIVGKHGGWKESSYLNHKLTLSTIFEGLLSIYFLIGIALGFLVKDYGLMFFHLLLTLGYGGVFYYSVYARLGRQP